MDYIQEEMNRQQAVMELLTEPSAERAAETPTAAAVRKVLAAAAETLDLGRNRQPETYDRESATETRSFRMWDNEEIVSRQRAEQLAEEDEAAVLRTAGSPWAEEETRGVPYRRGIFAGESAEVSGAAVRENRSMTRKEETDGRLSARELSLEIERDARRYDGGYPMY